MTDHDDDIPSDPVLAHLESISGQLDRMEGKIDTTVKRATIAGGISGGIAGAVTGALAGSVVPPLVHAGMELIKVKLGG